MSPASVSRSSRRRTPSLRRGTVRSRTPARRQSAWSAAARVTARSTSASEADSNRASSRPVVGSIVVRDIRLRHLLRSPCRDFAAHVLELALVDQPLLGILLERDGLREGTLGMEQPTL